MTRLLRRLRTWAARDYPTVVESVVRASTIEVGLQLLSMSTIFALMERIQRVAIGTLVCQRLASLARVVAVPYRIVTAQVTCLRRSLVLCAVLQRRGIPARVRIGVARQGGRLAAHAWVTVSDSSVDGPSQFLELTRVWSA